MVAVVGVKISWIGQYTLQQFCFDDDLIQLANDLP
jgi:hypothetical protein